MYKRIIIIGIIAVAGAIYIGTTHNSNKYEGHIVATRIAIDETIEHQAPGMVVPQYQTAHLVIIDPEKPEVAPKTISGKLAAACTPELSPDHNRLVYAGKKQLNDPWQIYVQTVGSNKPEQVTQEENDCFDPFFLPDGKIAFSKSMEDARLGEGHALYACNTDGSELQRITYHPHSDFAGSILHDGRIIYMSQQVFPQTGESKMMAMRPDGTKSELFYNIPESYKIISQMRACNNKKIHFIATGASSDKSNYLISIDYSDPYDHPEILLSESSGTINAFYPLDSGRFMLSYRSDVTRPFALYSYDSTSKNALQPVFTDSTHHLIEPIVIGQNQYRAKKLPTSVDDANDSGIMLCLNSNQYASDTNTRKASTVLILGIDGPLQEFPLAEDGSFYLKLVAKTPVRFQTLDSSKNVINGPSAWMWLMPNERRGCIGCHEKKTMVPDNKVPDAIHQPPVEIGKSVTDSFVDTVKHIASKGGQNEN